VALALATLGGHRRAFRSVDPFSHRIRP
jgi:hypothetical protein